MAHFQTLVNAEQLVGDSQADDQTKDDSPKDLAERVAEHGLEVFRGKLSFPVNLTKDPAPFVDDLGLFACRSPDTHGIMDDYGSKCGSNGKIGSPDSFGVGDAGYQGNDPCSMTGRHSPGTNQQMADELTFKQCIDEWLEQLRYKKR